MVYCHSFLILTGQYFSAHAREYIINSSNTRFTGMKIRVHRECNPPAMSPVLKISYIIEALAHAYFNHVTLCFIISSRVFMAVTDV